MSTSTQSDTVVSVRISPTLHAVLKRRAQDAQVPVSSYVRKVLANHVAEGTSAYAVKEDQ